MNWKDLLQGVLTIVVGFLLKWFLARIGVVIDEQLFITIVSAIVAWLLGLCFVEVARTFKVPGIR